MAKKNVKRILLRATREGADFDESVLESLERHGLSTAQDILGIPSFELVAKCDLPWSIVQRLVAAVSRAVAPPPALLNTLYAQHADPEISLASSLIVLDAYLRGGLPVSTITEVVGPAGVGKTQFAQMMSLLTVLRGKRVDSDDPSQSPSVIYFDTENNFSAQRLVEMAQSRKTVDGVEAIVKQIRVKRVQKSSVFMKELASIEVEMIEENVKLIVVDSVAALVRDEFERGNIQLRQALLSKMSAKLKEVAQNFRIPILVTNQVSGSKFAISAALGTLWSHAVNTRVVFEYASFKDWDNAHSLLLDESEAPQLRQMTIAKSPVSPVVIIPYYIDDSGLREVKYREQLSQSSQHDPVEDYVKELSEYNYWNQVISVERPT